MRVSEFKIRISTDDDEIEVLLIRGEYVEGRFTKKHQKQKQQKPFHINDCEPLIRKAAARIEKLEKKETRLDIKSPIKSISEQIEYDHVKW